MKIISFFCLIIQLFRQDNKQHYEQSLQHRTTKWSIKDSILWESKVLPDAILQLHANYAFKTDNPKIGHIKP